jgi:hydrogenase small subunit
MPSTRLSPGLYQALVERGMSRRSFLRLSAAMTATLALPASYVPRVVSALERAPRLPVIWLRGQSCGGETAAFLRAANPTAGTLLVETLTVDYADTLMGATGLDAERSRLEAMTRSAGKYLAVVEGAIPDAASGAFSMVGGRPFRDVVRDVCDGAAATFALGGCAVDGGLPGASGGATDARGVGKVVSGAKVLNLPGCPVNPENLAAAIVHYVTFGELPPADGHGRPLFAYGSLVHNECERRAHFEFGEFALAWGDEGAQKGWCLYKLGCKGPETFSNCPKVRWGESTSWPIRAGHGCIGCTMPGFWDSMGPAYSRLPSPIAFAPQITADQIGVGLVGAIGGGAALHAVGSAIRDRVVHAKEAKAATAAGAEPAATRARAIPAAPAAEPTEAGPAAGASPGLGERGSEIDPTVERGDD